LFSTFYYNISLLSNISLSKKTKKKCWKNHEKSFVQPTRHNPYIHTYIDYASKITENEKNIHPPHQRTKI